MKGKLYGIGVGPGDSELMTVKAARIVGEADVIITPKTEKKDGSVAYFRWYWMIMNNLKAGKKRVKLLLDC